MTPLEIKKELLERGISMRRIARQQNVSVGAVWMVINKGMVSNKIMQAVAEAIGKDKAEVFPSYFKKQDQIVDQGKQACTCHCNALTE